MKQIWEAVFSVGPSQLARHTVTYQLQEKMFSVWSVPRLYYKDQRDKPVSLEKVLSLETVVLDE
jgi:hypothetical protein